MASSPTVACPQCGAAVVWNSASAWRPFCSERCKLIDLGAWANESYRVHSESPDDEEPGVDVPDEGSRPRDD